MKRGNVLVIGNSGVGKSTLINSVLGVEKAKTGYGTSGTTDKLELYQSEDIPFRIIDTVGFEPSLLKGKQAINVIWFCVEGTTRKLFPKAIKDLSRATAVWKTVPVIVVITKSYSVPERVENIEMVKEAFAAPEGITELIDKTNVLMPEGIRAGAHDVYKFKLKRKKALAQSIVVASTTAAVTVGAIPIPIADALILSPIEVTQINSLARLYEINKDEQTKQFFNSIVEVGTVSVAAKTAISALKAIPGINIGASVLNAIMAGAIVAAIGEGSMQFVENVTVVVEQIVKSGNTKDIGKLINSLVSTMSTAKEKKTV